MRPGSFKNLIDNFSHLAAKCCIFMLKLTYTIYLRFVMDNYLQLPVPEKAAVLVTGCSTGFGKELTLRLATKGFVVRIYVLSAGPH